MIAIFHCCEDVLTAATAEKLLDRAIVEGTKVPDWLRELWAPEETRCLQRLFVDLQGQPGTSSRGEVKSAAEHYCIRINGGAGGAYATYARKCTALVGRLGPQLFPEDDIALLMSLDRDRRPADQTCRAGASTPPSPRFPVVVAEADPEVDAWIVAGFAPVSDHESGRHAQLTRTLKFDPVTNPERLSTTSEARHHSRGDAKLVCQALLGLDTQAHPANPAVQRCLEAPLDQLARNAQRSGLADFLDDVWTKVVPALTGGH